MSLKKMLSRLIKINFMFIFMFTFLILNQNAKAQLGFSGGVQAQAGFGGGYGGGMGGGAGYGGQGNWGSGQWGGQQACGYDQRAGGGAFDMSDDEKELRQKMLKISSKWEPYRTYACLHLWHWKDDK